MRKVLSVILIISAIGLAGCSTAPKDQLIEIHLPQVEYSTPQP
jgi:starvation-inducible outer membrane lipoprotein